VALEKSEASVRNATSDPPPPLYTVHRHRLTVMAAGMFRPNWKALGTCANSKSPHYAQKNSRGAAFAWREANTKLQGQFVRDPALTPRWILAGHPLHQCPDILR
jgi:hypothetical protein